MLLNKKNGIKVAVSLLILVAIYALGGFLLAPYFLKQAMERHFFQNYSAIIDIDDLRINPFSLLLETENLELRFQDGEPILSIEYFSGNLQMASLFRDYFEISEVNVRGPFISLHLLENGDSNFSRFLEGGDEQGQTPAFVLRNLLVSDGTLLLMQDQGELSRKLDLSEIRLQLGDFGTQAENSGRYKLSINANTMGQVEVAGLVNLFAQSSNGSISVSGVQIDSFTDWLPVIRTLQAGGEASSKLNYALEKKEQGWQLNMTRSSLELNNYVMTPNEVLKLDLQKFELTMSAKVTLNDEKVSTELIIDTAKINNIHVQDTQLNKNIVSGEKIELTRAVLDSENRKLTLKMIETNGAELQISRNKDASFDWLSYLQMAQMDQPAQVETEASEMSDWSLELDKVVLDKLNIKFTDRSTALESEHQLNNLKLEASDLSNQPGSSTDFTLQTLINEQGRLSIEGWLKPVERNAQFDLKLESLDLAAFTPYINEYLKLDIASGRLSMQAKVESEDAKHLANASLRIDQFALYDSSEEKNVSSVESIMADGILIKAMPLGVAVSSIELHQPFAHIAISGNNNLNVSDWLVNREKSEAKPVDAESQKPEFELSIAKVNIVNGLIDFQDGTLQPELRINLQSLNGNLDGLSLGADHAPAVLGLDGQVGEYGQVKIDGQLILSDLKKKSEVDMILKNIDTKMLSPYAGRFAGRKLKSGKLDLNLGYKIESGKVIGENSILLKDLILGERVESSQAIDLPLDLAIALLQDKDGKIDLSIPVSGDLNNPKFELGAVIGKAIGNLVTGFVTAPFKSLARMFGGKQEALDSIPFEPGLARITPPAAEILDTLATVLGDRPGLALIVKPGFDPARDKEALATLSVAEQLAQQAEGSAQTRTNAAPSFVNENVQRNLQNLGEKQLGAEKLAQIRNGIATRNKDGLEIDAASQEGVYARKLYEEIKRNTAVGVGQLTELAKARSSNIVTYLLQRDIEAARIKSAEIGEIKKTKEDRVLLQLELGSL